MFSDLLQKEFEPLKLYGYDVLFTKDRIDPSILPKGLHRYEIRKCDREMEIGDKIHSYFYGTYLSGSKITLTDGYKSLDPYEDIEYSEMEVIKLKDYMWQFNHLHKIVNKYIKH